MPAICCICEDNKINYNHKCHTCKKCVCDYCYGKIIQKSLLNTFNYKCPFCKTLKTDYLINLEKEHIILLLTNNNIEEKMMAKIDELIDENSELEDTIETLRRHINQLREIKDKEINELKKKLKGNTEDGLKIGSTYKQFFKENFKLIKSENPNMSSKDIMKKIGLEWQKHKDLIKNEVK
jgi:hypothetical protein